MLALPRVVAGDVDGDHVARRPAQGQARRLHVFVARIEAAQIGILVVAVMRARRRRDARGQLVLDQAHIGTAGEVQPSVIADRDVERGFVLARRLTGNDVDRAAQRVLAVERPLRSAQHLDPFQVEQFELRAEGARLEDAVDIDGDARIGRQIVDVADAEAADLENQAVRSVAAARLQHKVRRVFREIGGGLDLERVDARGAECGDGHAGRLQSLLDATRGHRDLLHPAWLRRRSGLRGNRTRHGQGENAPRRGARCKGKAIVALDHPTPPASSSKTMTAAAARRAHRIPSLRSRASSRFLLYKNSFYLIKRLSPESGKRKRLSEDGAGASARHEGEAASRRAG